MFFLVTIKGSPGRWAKDIAQKQLPFAMAKTLTDTASLVGKAAAKEAHKTMSIRKPWAGKYKSSRIGQPPSPPQANTTTPANRKTPLNRMHSTVGTVGWQIAQQISDKKSTRRPLKAKQLYIPLQAKRTKSQSPRVMLSKGRVALSKRGNLILYYKDKPMYKLVKQQEIKPRYNLYDIARTKSQRYATYFFKKAMDYAVKTAKKP
jgi:hypothetical protein